MRTNPIGLSHHRELAGATEGSSHRDQAQVHVCSALGMFTPTSSLSSDCRPDKWSSRSLTRRSRLGDVYSIDDEGSASHPRRFIEDAIPDRQKTTAYGIAWGRECFAAGLVIATGLAAVRAEHAGNQGFMLAVQVHVRVKLGCFRRSWVSALVHTLRLLTGPRSLRFDMIHNQSNESRSGAGGSLP